MRKAAAETPAKMNDTNVATVMIVFCLSFNLGNEYRDDLRLGMLVCNFEVRYFCY